MRKVPYVLSRKDRIFTVVFQKLDSPADPPYHHNKSREDRERELNKKVVEKSIDSMGDLIALNSPFVKPEDVDARIRRHYLSWLSFAFSFVAAIGSVVAAIFAVVTLFRAPVEEPHRLSSEEISWIRASTAAAKPAINSNDAPGKLSIPDRPSAGGITEDKSKQQGK